jgi:hypothetical protein
VAQEGWSNPSGIFTHGLFLRCHDFSKGGTMNTESMTIEEARELAELTSTIVRNLKTINDDPNSPDDLDELEKRTTTIVRHLKTIDNADVETS